MIDVKTLYGIISKYFQTQNDEIVCRLWISCHGPAIQIVETKGLNSSTFHFTWEELPNLNETSAYDRIAQHYRRVAAQMPHGCNDWTKAFLKARTIMAERLNAGDQLEIKPVFRTVGFDDESDDLLVEFSPMFLDSDASRRADYLGDLIEFLETARRASIEKIYGRDVFSKRTKKDE